MDCMQPARLLCPWNFPGNNTGVGCHFLLQGIFLTQESNPRLLRWQVDSLALSHQGNPNNRSSFHLWCAHPVLWMSTSELPKVRSLMFCLHDIRHVHIPPVYHIFYSFPFNWFPFSTWPGPKQSSVKSQDWLTNENVFLTHMETHTKWTESTYGKTEGQRRKATCPM